LYFTHGQKELGACRARSMVWRDCDGNEAVGVTIATLCFGHCRL